MSGCVMSDWISMSNVLLDCINKLNETAGSLTLCKTVNIDIVLLCYLLIYENFMTNKVFSYYTSLFYLDIFKYIF